METMILSRLPKVWACNFFVYNPCSVILISTVYKTLHNNKQLYEESKF